MEEDKKGKVNRPFGGCDHAVDPYITGFFFTRWTLPNCVLNNTKEIKLISDAERMLASTNLSFILPGGYIEVDKNDLSNSARVIDNELYSVHLELTGLPIYNIISAWYNETIRARSFASNNEDTSINYKGDVYYWTTQPNGRIVEYSTKCIGIYPIKNPSSDYSSNITDNNKLELDIPFHADKIEQSEEIKETCTAFAESYYNAAKDEHSIKNVGDSDEEKKPKSI